MSFEGTVDAGYVFIVSSGMPCSQLVTIMRNRHVVFFMGNMTRKKSYDY